jgi:hypothetical protein
MSKNNISALEMSTNKILEEKVTLEKKYANLKEEYRRLRTAYQSKDK